MLKILVQQKRIYLVLAALVIGILTITGYSGKQYYPSLEIASYHQYIDYLSGPITEDSLAYLEQEQQEIDELYVQMSELETKTMEQKELQIKILQSEIDRKEGGMTLVLSQLEYMKTMDGKMNDKFWVDEIDYWQIWNDYGTDIIRWTMGMIAAFIWISGIYSFDSRKRLLPLLRATKLGKTVKTRQMHRCAILGTLFFFFVSESVNWIQVWQIDGLSGWNQRMCDFSRLGISTSLTLGLFLIIVSFIKLLSFVVGAIVAIGLSEKTHSEVITIIAGIAIVGIVAIAMYYFQLDLYLMFIYYI